MPFYIDGQIFPALRLDVDLDFPRVIAAFRRNKTCDCEELIFYKLIIEFTLADGCYRVSLRSSVVATLRRSAKQQGTYHSTNTTIDLEEKRKRMPRRCKVT